jgi:hypothetical protein
VAGTVALMLQANPSLTPNLVKAILQYSAEHKTRYNELTQGAGFLNARGAVQIARLFATGENVPAISANIDPTPWNRHINWGNHRIGGGILKPDANAWRLDVTWGAAATDAGDSIVWGSVCSGSDCGTTIRGSSSDEDNIVWGTSSGADEDNIVWGTTCGGADCANTVWGSGCSLNVCVTIVWGSSSDEDNIVWGTSAGAEEDNIVWGTANEINVSWRLHPGEEPVSTAPYGSPPSVPLRS